MIQKETSDLISFALQMAEQTGGMLDPSIYPVLCAWGFTTENKQVPSADELESLLENVDYRKILLDGTKLMIPEGMQIDLGAVGKGYAAENEMLSVTIVSSQGELSDALSTALYVMGSEEAENYWRNRDGFEMILITNENEVTVTEGHCRAVCLKRRACRKGDGVRKMKRQKWIFAICICIFLAGVIGTIWIF